MRDATVVVVVFLHKVARRTRHEIGDFLNVVGGVELFYQSCAELEIDAAVFEKLNTGKNLSHIDVLNADGVRVFFGAVFHVHCDVIDEFVVEHGFKNVGAKSVGVEFGCVTHTSHLCQKIAEVGLKRGFSARHANGVHESFALLKVIENLAFVYLLRFEVADDKRRVVAERTAKITPARKHGASDFAVEIDH